MKIIAISGESESGKSTAGRFFEQHGWARLKIADFYRNVYHRVTTDLDLPTWSIQMDRTKPEWIADQFIKELKDHLNKTGTDHCTIESLHGIILAKQLKARLKDSISIVYVDAPYCIRLRRQLLRENLTSINDARSYLDPRDAQKKDWGVLQVKNIADEIVDNSKDLPAYKRALTEIHKYYY